MVKKSHLLLTIRQVSQDLSAAALSSHATSNELSWQPRQLLGARIPVLSKGLLVALRIKLTEDTLTRENQI